MLQDIRDRSTGWVSKAIIGVIVILLSLTGFEAITSTTSNVNNAARVNGEPITQNELAQARSMQLRQLSQQLGPDFDLSLLDDKLITDMALNKLITRALLVQGAQADGFVTSESIIDAFLLNTPDFQENGVFSAARYDQVLAQMGYSRMQFRYMLNEDLLLEQLQNGLAGSAFVTEQEVRAIVQLESQTRDFDYVILEPDLNALSVTDEEIQDYYQANLPAYMTPEQVIAEYVEINKSQLLDQVEVSEAELRERYELSIANLEEQRRAAHILFEIDSDLSEQEAYEQAVAAAERLAAGESFAALAQELSDDVGSAAQGGDLGFAGRDIFDPVFEEALFALQKGEVSEPVLTDFGWHLIKLVDMQAADVQSFEQMQAALLREIQQEKVEQQFIELAQQLESLAYESADLQQPAAELGLSIQTSSAFGREGSDGVFANPVVVDAAFSDAVLLDGANSHPIELNRDSLVVLRIKEHLQPKQLELAEVIDTVRELLIAEKASQQTLEQGQALLAELQQGTEVEASWNSAEAVKRSGSGLESQLVQAAFRMPQPKAETAVYEGLSFNDGRYALIRLTAVNSPVEELTADEIKLYQSLMSSRQGQIDFAAYNRQLRDEAEIEQY